MKVNKILIMVCVSIIPFTACKRDEGPFIIVDSTRSIHFEKDVQSIFNARCISCHTQNHYLNLESCCSYDMLWDGKYIDTLNPSESYLYQQIKLPNPMMPYNSAPLSEQEINDILQWIENGAKND